MLNDLKYVQISQTPNARLDNVLRNETTVQAGGSYLAIGFVGQHDYIAIVDSEGRIITLPFDEDDFSFD